MIYFFFKAICDRIIALIALLLLAPMLLAVALLVLVNLGSPVLFHQQRIGYRGKAFWLVKFRSMTDDRDSSGALLADTYRLKPFGCWLRSTSLDELPELWNVLKGEMSLVGPRPLLMRYLPFFSERELSRFKVLPGMTGYAQVQGRNLCGWDQRLAADVKYAVGYNLWIDLRILLKTAFVVTRGHGVLVDPSLSMKDLDTERAHSLHVKQVPSSKIISAGKLIQSEISDEIKDATILSAVNFPFFLKQVLLKESKLMGVFRGQEMLAAICYIVHDAFFHVNYFAVLHSERSKGIGKKLINYLKFLSGGLAVTLHVDSRNHDAIRFYSRNGFREVSRQSTCILSAHGSGRNSLEDYIQIINSEQYKVYGISHSIIDGIKVGIIDGRFVNLPSDAPPRVLEKCLMLPDYLKIRCPVSIFKSLLNERPAFVNVCATYDIILMQWTPFAGS